MVSKKKRKKRKKKWLQLQVHTLVRGQEATIMRKNKASWECWDRPRATVLGGGEKTSQLRMTQELSLAWRSRLSGEHELRASLGYSVSPDLPGWATE